MQQPGALGPALPDYLNQSAAGHFTSAGRAIAVRQATRALLEASGLSDDRAEAPAPSLISSWAGTPPQR